jgi:hypothetical protein
MTKQKRLDGKKKCLALTSKLELDMLSFCRDKNIDSQSELVRQAIAKYIYADYQDDSLKLQGMKKIQDQITELRDMLEVSFKYLTRFHISMLAYHPEIDEPLADAAFRSAVTRHDKFLNVFQDSMKNDPPFFERLLHKFFSEDNGQS